MRWIILCSVIAGTMNAAERIPHSVPARIKSANLFKNGLAFVTGVIELPGGGTYFVEEVPRPVHGTFWIESAAGVSVAVVEREIAKEIETEEEMLQAGRGRELIVQLKEESDPIRGRLVLAKPEKPVIHPLEATAAIRPYFVPLEMLILDTDKGRVFVRRSEVVSITMPDIVDRLNVTRPVLQIVSNGEEPRSLRYHYLARGLGWAPSYQVDISDPAKLGLRQSAVIKNELADFSESELGLITGYPSIEFANVSSPLTPGMNWQTFFAQLQGRGRDSFIDVTMQNAYVPMPRAADGEDLSIQPPTGEEVDLHVEPIGKQSLKVGESFLVSTADQPADYERIVEWKVPPARKESGEAITHSRGPSDNSMDVSDAWDALRFRNPLAFPLTTAPAMIVAGGNFHGQRTLPWTNPGELVILRVNKALSVETSYVEVENPLEEQQLISYGRLRYRKPTVTGRLKVKNGRTIPIKVMITGSCVGELKAASDNPVVQLADRSGYSLNKRQELIWTLAMPPGTEKEITYQYEVLVPQ